jgi:hypothetical protein
MFALTMAGPTDVTRPLTFGLALLLPPLAILLWAEPRHRAVVRLLGLTLVMFLALLTAFAAIQVCAYRAKTASLRLPARSFDWFHPWWKDRDATNVGWQCCLTAMSSAVLTSLALGTSGWWRARRSRATAAQAFAKALGACHFAWAPPPSPGYIQPVPEGVREGQSPLRPASGVPPSTSHC